ncbi:unnamed protein product [Leptosia nina]|uniref:TIL domain-containing protein n=1 Tax=Leptosia nina TaxID=320188 RepID=A0AAV1JWV5_9NEOP
MKSYVVFYCIVFLYCVHSLDADPMQCYGHNEILDCVLPCPPQKTCKNRELKINCLDVIQPCRTQCVCKPGFLRNAKGDCVEEEGCVECPGNHEFFSCGPVCDNECSTLHERNRTKCPILNIMCNKKCYCKDGYARDKYGICIPIEECPKVCPSNEEFTNCKKSCPPETCISIVAKFKCDSREECVPGCICKPNYLRKTADGPCLPIRECPQLDGSLDFS